MSRTSVAWTLLVTLAGTVSGLAQDEQRMPDWFDGDILEAFSEIQALPLSARSDLGLEGAGLAAMLCDADLELRGVVVPGEGAIPILISFVAPRRIGTPPLPDHLKVAAELWGIATHITGTMPSSNHSAASSSPALEELRSKVDRSHAAAPPELRERASTLSWDLASILLGRLTMFTSLFFSPATMLREVAIGSVSLALDGASAVLSYAGRDSAIALSLASCPSFIFYTTLAVGGAVSAPSGVTIAAGVLAAVQATRNLVHCQKSLATVLERIRTPDTILESLFDSLLATTLSDPGAAGRRPGLAGLGWEGGGERPDLPARPDPGGSGTTRPGVCVELGRRTDGGFFCFDRGGDGPPDRGGRDGGCPDRSGGGAG